MKQLVKRLLIRAVANERFWKWYETSLPRDTFRFVEWERAKYLDRIEREWMAARAREISPDLTVRHGPFEGMRYLVPESDYPLPLPKLLGSYESELHPVFDAIESHTYSEIVNVGCAEGYYAVGMALRLPRARIYAFDVDPLALQQCGEMARLNGVEDRVVLGSDCDEGTLKALPLTHRALVICDCEGYEKELLTRDVARALAEHDLLVEVHDSVDDSVSAALRERFADTHRLAVFQTIDDAIKARGCTYKELERHDSGTRRKLVREGRGAAMEWFSFTHL